MKFTVHDKIIYRLSLANNQEEKKAQAIAAQLKMPLRNLQTSLTYLMASGMLTRESKISKEGRRCYYYALTKEGKEHAELLQLNQQFGLKRGKRFI